MCSTIGVTKAVVCAIMPSNGKSSPCGNICSTDCLIALCSILYGFRTSCCSTRLSLVQVLACVLFRLRQEMKGKERNVLLSDAQNTFYFIWSKTVRLARKETRCHHMGYPFRLATRDILFAPSHRKDSTYHGLCYTCRRELA